MSDREQEEINDVLFGLWERGINIGAVAMLNELVRLELIADPMADMIMEAMHRDVIELKIGDDVQREAIQDAQEKIDSLYMEKNGKEGRG